MYDTVEKYGSASLVIRAFVGGTRLLIIRNGCILRSANLEEVNIESFRKLAKREGGLIPCGSHEGAD